MSNMTESRRVEDKLCRSEELPRRIFENLKDYAIFTIDLDGNFSSWSPGVENVLGFREDEFIGQPYAIIFTPEDRASGEPEKRLEETVRTGSTKDDRWHVHKNGRLIWANGIVIVIKDGDGSLQEFVKILRDYTESRLQEEKLERQIEDRTKELYKAEQRFERIFRVGPFAAVLTTLGAEHQFLDANQSFERLTGYTREEVIGKTNRELGMWSSPEEAQSVHEMLAQGQARDLELTITTKEDDKRTVMTSAALLADNGQFVVRMFYDITERKRNEEELSRAIQEVMREATWFSRVLVEKLTNIRSGKADGLEVAELTQRERQVLVRIASGMNNNDIGRELGISNQTVRNYITNIYSKIGVKTRAEAVVWARERGLVGP